MSKVVYDLTNIFKKETSCYVDNRLVKGQEGIAARARVEPRDQLELLQ